jgi:glycosyltransferase involved in cell wall biosynthesis
MLHFAHALEDGGHPVTLLLSATHAKYRTRRRKADKGAVQIVETPHWTLFNDRQDGWGLLDWMWRVTWVLRRRPAIVVMASHKPSCLLPALIARLLGAKILYDWVDWWSGPGGIYKAIVLSSDQFQSMAMPIRLWRRLTFFLDQAFEWFAPRMAHQTVLITRDLADHPFAPPYLQDSPVVISGAPLSEILPGNKPLARRAIRPSLPASDNEIWYGYMAGFHGAEQLLLDALTIVANQGHPFRLIVAGAPLSKMSPKHSKALSGRIEHLGRIPFEKVGQFLAACDLLLLPLTPADHDRGRYPHKLGDYLAAGRPTLLTRVGEAARRMEFAGLGDMISEPNPEAFAQLIVGWQIRPNDWPEANSRVRKAAESYWDWTAIHGQIRGLVSSLISR